MEAEERGIHQGREARVLQETGRIYACSRKPASCHGKLSLQTTVGPYMAIRLFRPIIVAVVVEELQSDGPIRRVLELHKRLEAHGSERRRMSRWDYPSG